MQLSAMSAYMEEPEKTIFSDPENHMEKLSAIARQDPELDALLHTTMAVTMASGSQQSNVMPSHASATVNCRLLQGDTSESVFEYIRSHIPDNLGVRHISGSSPEPAQEIDAGGPLRKVSDTLKELYGPNTVIVPSLMAGGTDSRFYVPICSNVFRFGSLLRDDRWGKAHEVDEKIPCDALPTGVSFFRAFLKKYNQTSED
jgi:carboxypeptidase PM20D1